MLCVSVLVNGRLKVVVPAYVFSPFYFIFYLSFVSLVYGGFYAETPIVKVFLGMFMLVL